MALGFAKIFVIFLFISIIIGIGTHSWVNFFSAMGIFILIRIVWKLLT
jgi:hypothetical protein